jgi:hypothetical protein
MDELLKKKKATTEKLLEAVFPMRSAPKLYIGDRNAELGMTVLAKTSSNLTNRPLVV